MVIIFTDHKDIEIDDSGIHYEHYNISVEDCTEDVLNFVGAVSNRIEELKQACNTLLQEEQEDTWNYEDWENEDND